ncbi:hypothetical protein V3N99_21830 [Dermatophilaceae bacterium Soc4.6]
MDAADHEPAGQVLGLPGGRERGEVRLGDLRFGDPPILVLVPDRPRVLVVIHAPSGMTAIARATPEFIRTVTENHALALRAAVVVRSRR